MDDKKIASMTKEKTKLRCEKRRWRKQRVDEY